MSDVVSTGRDAWLREALRLQSLSRWPEALACYEQAVRVSPRDLQTLIPLGFAYIQLKSWGPAAETYEQIVALLPKDHRIWCNLSYLYEHAGELKMAEDRARKALRLTPDCAEAWNNLGMALRGQHRFTEAMQSFRRAAECQTGFALAEYNLAATQLLSGNFELGWNGYESRCRLPEARLRTELAPRWTGATLPGGKLLVYHDQGAGDMLQFSRLLPAVRARSQARIVLSCPGELLDLMRTAHGVDEVVLIDEEPADASAETAVSSLPAVLRINLSDVPGEVPYLAPPERELSPGVVETLREFPLGTRKVGLVWQGNPAQAHDYVRSVALRKLLPLAEVAGIRWLSLQVNDAGRLQLPEVEAHWHLPDVGGRLTDFAETAALLQHLDLVITVDTSLAHLAGALGRPVWTMLGHTPDWRWGIGGQTCPWYSSMRLFRQSRWGDWEHVVQQVKQALLSKWA